MIKSYPDTGKASNIILIENVKDLSAKSQFTFSNVIFLSLSYTNMLLKSISVVQAAETVVVTKFLSSFSL